MHIVRPDDNILPRVSFGPELCHDLQAGLEREWLVTNGIGGYAAAGLNGAHTRRYHGLLVAALTPPLNRTLLLGKFEERVNVSGQRYELQVNQFHHAHDVSPKGFNYLQSFELEGSIPTWRYSLGEAILRKTVWLEHGSNTTYVKYVYEQGHASLDLELVVLANYRDYHSQTKGADDWEFLLETEQARHCWRIRAWPEATAWRLLAFPNATFESIGVWYKDFFWLQEQRRGLADLEDMYNPGNLHITLQPGQEVTIVATTEAAEVAERFYPGALERELERQRIVLTTSSLEDASTTEMAQRLTLAADQFIVGRPQPDIPGQLIGDYRTVLAGYHWFGDWGRDTMIALPGLCLVTGRHRDAANILRSFARTISQGMLPNRFPDAATTPEYNTVDATLWYFDAISRYQTASGDLELVKELFPTLVGIIEWHLKGTRYGIKVDPQDGLLMAGEPGVQLTWMDAKIGDWVVTPRQGKAIEINALWYNALKIMQNFAAQGDFVQDPTLEAEYARLAAQVKANFERVFWYAAGGYYLDVIDQNGQPDATLRPNQAIALAVAPALFTPTRACSALDIIKQKLLTPFGLRTLSPADPNYIGHYGGDQRVRDSAYHQGTIWPWLLGPYVRALLHFSPDRPATLTHVRALLKPFAQHLNEAGLNTVSEIFEADSPYSPVGCVAQAWSVAALLDIIEAITIL